jgi:hypothetical protein
MRKSTSVVGILVLFIGYVLLHGSSLGADKATEKTQKVAFVDLDGDGFDDNATPEQQNSTIDKLKSDATGASSDTTKANAGFFDFGSVLTTKSQLFLNNSGAFAFAKQRVVSGLQHRGGFGSGGDFGSGSDISSGAVVAGVCVGGVCH